MQVDNVRHVKGVCNLSVGTDRVNGANAAAASFISSFPRVAFLVSVSNITWRVSSSAPPQSDRVSYLSALISCLIPRSALPMAKLGRCFCGKGGAVTHSEHR